MMKHSLRGFTLIEILIVIVIIGIMAGVVVLSVGGNDVRELRTEAKRVQQLLRLVADEAVFQQKEFGLVADENHYAIWFYSYRQKTWQADERDAFLSYQLPPHIGLRLQVEGEFRLPSSTDEEDFTGDGAEQEIVPNLLFLSSGDYPVFSLELFLRDKTSHKAVVSSDGLDLPILEYDF